MFSLVRPLLSSDSGFHSVRRSHRYYEPVRLLRGVHLWFCGMAFPDRPVPSGATQVSRFPTESFPTCMGPLTTPAPHTTRVCRHVGFCLPHPITGSAAGMEFSKLNLPARWCRCLRFGLNLAIQSAGLAARVVRYSFSVELFHLLLSAGLPAHNWEFQNL